MVAENTRKVKQEREEGFSSCSPPLSANKQVSITPLPSPSPPPPFLPPSIFAKTCKHPLFPLLFSSRLHACKTKKSYASLHRREF